MSRNFFGDPVMGTPSSRRNPAAHLGPAPCPKQSRFKSCPNPPLHVVLATFPASDRLPRHLQEFCQFDLGPTEASSGPRHELSCCFHCPENMGRKGLPVNRGP